MTQFRFWAVFAVLIEVPQVVVDAGSEAWLAFGRGRCGGGAPEQGRVEGLTAQMHWQVVKTALVRGQF